MKKDKLISAVLTTETPPPAKVSTDLLTECEITDETEIPPQKPIIIVGGKNYLMQGDFSIITGEKKSGKSHALRRVVTTALMPEIPENFDSLDIRTIYEKDKYIVYIDTEQHPSKTKQMMQYCWKRAGLNCRPQTLKVYNIRAKETEERVKFISDLINTLGSKIYIMIVDGISDLLDSINDEILSKKLAQTFFSNDKYQISYVFAIHERKGGGGAMGWLGQHIEKKAGGGIMIQKDTKNDIHSINCSFLRDDGNFRPIEFKYDEQIKDFRTLAPEETMFMKEKSKEEKERDKLRETEQHLIQSFGGLKEISKANLLQMLINNDPKQRGEKSARRIITDSLKLGMILETDKKLFKLNIEK